MPRGGGMVLSGQDWGSVSFSKKRSGGGSSKPTKSDMQRAARSGTMGTHSRGRQANASTFGHGIMGTTAGQKGRGLAEETETFKIAKVSVEMRVRIMKARTAAGLTQKALAQRLNVKPSVIQSYENGKGNPGGSMLQKIESVCGLPYGTLTGKKRKGKKKK